MSRASSGRIFLTELRVLMNPRSLACGSTHGWRVQQKAQKVERSNGERGSANALAWVAFAARQRSAWWWWPSQSARGPVSVAPLGS
jgi:hypothetical protein